MKNEVRFYREKNNLTQSELAEKSGISLRTIQRIENGNPLKGFTLESIANALKVLPENLLTSHIDVERIKLINIATLSFFIIPFGNIIVPTILTYKSKSKKSKALGKDIVSTQIIWTITLSVLLIITPFTRQWIPFNIPFLIILLICINVFIVFKNAVRLTNKSELYITPRIRLL
nr:helix-turn-helix domain-containing protein [uncultured Allomuricauda sp.]